MIIHVRKHERNFVVLASSTLRNKSLSFRARGLWAVMMTFPDDWNIHVPHLGTLSETEGIKSVRTILRELEAAGLARLVTDRGDGGKVSGKHWDLFETADLSEDSTDLPFEGNSVHRPTPQPTVGETERRSEAAITNTNKRVNIEKDREREEPKSVSIYREVTGIDPPMYFEDLIALNIPDRLDTLEHWRAVCLTWRDTPNWSERQVKKMIEDFLAQREPRKGSGRKQVGMVHAVAAVDRIIHCRECHESGTVSIDYAGDVCPKCKTITIEATPIEEIRRLANPDSGEE